MNIIIALYALGGLIFAVVMQRVSKKLRDDGVLEENSVIVFLGEALSFVIEWLLWPLFLFLLLLRKKK